MELSIGLTMEMRLQVIMYQRVSDSTALTFTQCITYGFNQCVSVYFIYSPKPSNAPLADNLVVAIYSYEPTHNDDLGFEKGEKLKIINK